MAGTEISARDEREAREAESSRAGGGEDEGDAGRRQGGGGGSEEKAPVRQEAREGSSVSEADGGAEQRSGMGGGEGGSGEGHEEGAAVDIEMGDGDLGREGRVKEGEQACALGDVVTPRNSKRAAPEIELSQAVSKKERNAWPSNIMGGLPEFSKELVGCVQDQVDSAEAVDRLREAITGLVNARNVLHHKLLDIKSGTKEKLAKDGGQVANP